MTVRVLFIFLHPCWQAGYCGLCRSSAALLLKGHSYNITALSRLKNKQTTTALQQSYWSSDSFFWDSPSFEFPGFTAREGRWPLLSFPNLCSKQLLTQWELTLKTEGSAQAQLIPPSRWLKHMVSLAVGSYLDGLAGNPKQWQCLILFECSLENVPHIRWTEVFSVFY